MDVFQFLQQIGTAYCAFAMFFFARNFRLL